MSPHVLLQDLKQELFSLYEDPKTMKLLNTKPLYSAIVPGLGVYRWCISFSREEVLFRGTLVVYGDIQLLLNNPRQQTGKCLGLVYRHGKTTYEIIEGEGPAYEIKYIPLDLRTIYRAFEEAGGKPLLEYEPANIRRAVKRWESKVDEPLIPIDPGANIKNVELVTISDMMRMFHNNRPTTVTLYTQDSRKPKEHIINPRFVDHRIQSLLGYKC